LVILGGVFAGVKLLTRDSSPKPTKPVRNVTQPTTQPTSQPTPQETTQPTGAPTPAPDSGSLADLVEDPVGKWSAQDVQDSPDIAANWGANDALTVTYASGKGGLTFVIAAYASPEDAETAVPQLAQSVVDSLGYRVVNQDDVQGQDGSHLGQVILLEGDDEVVLWSNGSYVRWAEGPRGASVDFYGHSSF
jgi:hypothetical protein